MGESESDEPFFLKTKCFGQVLFRSNKCPLCHRHILLEPSKALGVDFGPDTRCRCGWDYETAKGEMFKIVGAMEALFDADRSLTRSDALLFQKVGGKWTCQRKD